MQYKVESGHRFAERTSTYRLAFVGVPCYPIFRRFTEMFTEWGGNVRELDLSVVRLRRLRIVGYEYDLDRPIESLAEGVLLSVRDAMDSMFHNDTRVVGDRCWTEFEARRHRLSPHQELSNRIHGLWRTVVAHLATSGVMSPSLFIESDMMDRRVVSEAQLKNRVDAFFEGLNSRRQQGAQAQA